MSLRGFMLENSQIYGQQANISGKNYYLLKK